MSARKFTEDQIRATCANHYGTTFARQFMKSLVDDALDAEYNALSRECDALIAKKVPIDGGKNLPEFVKHHEKIGRLFKAMEAKQKERFGE